MNKTIRLTALAHSKHRNAIGMVGIEVEPIKQEISVRLAKQWPRNDLNKIAPEVAELYNKFQWFNTIIDFNIGDHVIQGLRRAGGMPIRIIHVQKKVKDRLEIERVRTMDIIEMTQFMLQQKLAHKIVFPKEPTKDMQELESQIALFSEMKTEAGGIDYYAPGDEFDNLTKALIIVCFGARPYLQTTGEVVGGPITKSKFAAPEAELMFESTADVTSRGFRRKL